MHKQLLPSHVKRSFKILSGREENKRLVGCSPVPFTMTFSVIGQGNCSDCRQPKGRGIDESLQTHFSTAVLGRRRGRCRQAIYTKGHTCTNIPNVTWRNKNTSWTHHHLILDKLKCLNRGSSKIILFQWTFVYWHHLMPYDVAMVTGKNTLLLAFHVKWLQLMMSLC